MLKEVYFLTEKYINVQGREMIALRGQTLDIEEKDALAFELEGSAVITSSDYKKPKTRTRVKAKANVKKKTTKTKAKKRGNKKRTNNKTNNGSRKSRKSKRLPKN